jgi:hypothetical protein
MNHDYMTRRADHKPRNNRKKKSMSEDLSQGVNEGSRAQVSVTTLLIYPVIMWSHYNMTLYTRHFEMPLKVGKMPSKTF